MRLALGSPDLNERGCPVHEKCRSGGAALEFALVLPFLVTLLLGALELGRLLEVRQILDNAVREGGRQAAAGQLTNSQIQDVVINYLKDAGIPTQNVSVTVANLNSPGTEVSTANQFDPLQIAATIPPADVLWLNSTVFSNAGTLLTAQAIWPSLVNQSYPTGISAPAGN
jgi:Flp pilus assembly protein TadG